MADRVEANRLATTTGFQGVQVVAEIGHLQLPATRSLAATQDRLDTGNQLGQREGLDQIVVGTGLQPLDAVRQRIAGGEHDDRRIAPGIVAQALAHLQPVDARQHQVQHDQVVVLGGGQVQTAEAILRAVDHVALELKVVQHVGENVTVVFDDQDAHRWGTR